MGLALYRTYRPGSLAEVIGQEHVTDPLARALSAGRTHHAYLFSGPRGCGKTSTARIIARSLNCEQGPTAEPCGTCRSCVELAPNGPGSIDVVELDAATHRGIDDARELREKAVYAPAASRFKIYIIDEAHQLTNEAANALLKLVEEPPAHLRFIFATTEPDKIIPTIRSRTFHYGFRLVPARVLAEHLLGVCTAEGVPAEGPALAVVARAGAGSVRDSLSVLGQLLAGAGPEGLTYADAVSALGLTEASVIDSFVAALAHGSAAEMFGIVDEVISAGHDPRRFVTDVLERLRDLIILRADPSALDSGLVDVPDDAGERMLAQAESLGLAELSRAADLVSTGLSEIKGATAPRLQLELLCARLALPSVADDHASLAARLDRLERAVSEGGAPSGAGARSEGPGVPASAPGRGPAVASSGGGGSAATPAQAPERAAAPAPPAAAAPTPAEPSGGPGVRPAPPRRPSLRTEAPEPAAAPAPAPDPATNPAGEGAAHDPHPESQSTRSAPATAPTTSAETAAAEPAAAAPEPAAATRAATTEPAGAPAAAEPGAPAPVATEPESEPVSGDLAAIQRGWSDVLARLATDSRVAWTAFHGAAPLSVAGGVLAVAVREPGHVRAIAARGHDERLRQALIDVLGQDLSIDVVHDPGAPGAGAGSAAGRPAGPSERSGPPSTGAPSSGAPRGGSLARAAAVATSAPAEAPDEPSADDPDLDASGGDGLALVTRELGAKPIGTIDHS